MTPLTQRAAIYRRKHPRQPVDDDAWLTCWRFNNPKPRRFTLTGSGADVGAVLYRACGHDVEAADE